MAVSACEVRIVVSPPGFSDWTGLPEALARANGRRFVELEARIELTENHETFAALGFSRVAESAHPGFDRPTSITMRKPVPA
jgi:MoxR-like ATPase